MRVRLVRRPGQHGTKAYVDQHGDRLICVRYRYDEAAKRRYKTIEIIVDEQPWEPRVKVKERAQIAPDTLVGIRIRREEAELRKRLKSVGGWWSDTLRVWSLRYEQVVTLGLADRIVGTIDELIATRSEWSL